jgi:uncharacterized protein (TIGR00255 family)
MSAGKPIHSMTGFAQVTGKGPLGTVMLEMRSVNARFLEISLRLPDELRASEPLIRERIQASLARGKVDVRASIQAEHRPSEELQLNPDMLDALMNAETQIRSRLPEAARLSVAQVLRFPGVIREATLEASNPIETFKPVVQQAVHALSQSRAREGERLKTVILERVQTMHGIIRKQAERAPELLRQHESRLIERLKTVAESALGDSALPYDETMSRIRQEVALHGMKSDVVEELQRLDIHLQELADLMNQGGSVGRKLDFLMQELNREANTLGSKSADLTTTASSLELKVLIEQVREQIQNLE